MTRTGLCFGGPLDGELVAHTSYSLLAYVPQRLTAAMMDSPPLTPITHETFEYRWSKYGLPVKGEPHVGDSAVICGAWVPKGDERKVETLINAVLGLHRLLTGAAA